MKVKLSGKDLAVTLTFWGLGNWKNNRGGQREDNLYILSRNACYNMCRCIILSNAQQTHYCQKIMFFLGRSLFFLTFSIQNLIGERCMNNFGVQLFSLLMNPFTGSLLFAADPPYAFKDNSEDQDIRRNTRHGMVLE